MSAQVGDLQPYPSRQEPRNLCQDSREPVSRAGRRLYPTLPFFKSVQDRYPTSLHQRIGPRNCAKVPGARLRQAKKFPRAFYGFSVGMGCTEGPGLVEFRAQKGGGNM